MLVVSSIIYLAVNSTLDNVHVERVKDFNLTLLLKSVGQCSYFNHEPPAKIRGYV